MNPDYFCVECETPIEGDDIDARHTRSADGEDVHARCCQECLTDRKEA